MDINKVPLNIEEAICVRYGLKDGDTQMTAFKSCFAGLFVVAFEDCTGGLSIDYVKTENIPKVVLEKLTEKEEH